LISLSLSLTACGDDESLPTIDIEAPLSPINETSLKKTALGSGPGHWTKEIRGVSIDEQDYVVLSAAKDRVEESFGTLVINVPLVDKRTGEECLMGDRGQNALPASTVPRILDQVNQRGLNFDRVVVQVDLFKPQRDDFHRLCLDESGASKPSYYLSEMRGDVITAFDNLARVSEIDAIVVGLELNQYASLSEMIAFNRSWDYANLISLYQEVYSTVKAQNSAINVGPSVSWPSLKLDLIPQVAAEFDLEEDNLLTLEIALRRTVWPLLWDGSQASADFVGVALFARTAEAPYLGNPAPEDKTPIREFYRELPQVAAHPELETPLPIAITSIDWSTINNASGGLKTDYLIGLKDALSHMTPSWVAWRRLSNIPEDPPETSPCRSVVNLGHDKDFCFAGLLDINGQPRSVWDEFVALPE
jgi:hypothetical protein